MILWTLLIIIVYLYEAMTDGQTNQHREHAGMKGLKIMTGSELKKQIEENHAEDLEIWAMDDGCGIYPVNKVIVKEIQGKTVILLDE